MSANQGEAVNRASREDALLAINPDDIRSAEEALRILRDYGNPKGCTVNTPKLVLIKKIRNQQKIIRGELVVAGR
jgi:hypothetical protein